MSETTNGNGNNKVLMGLVIAVVANTALTTWASSGTKALDKVQVLEVSQAVVKADVDALKRDLAEIKETTRAIWRAMDEERKERKGRER